MTVNDRKCDDFRALTAVSAGILIYSSKLSFSRVRNVTDEKKKLRNDKKKKSLSSV